MTKLKAIYAKVSKWFTALTDAQQWQVIASVAILLLFLSWLVL